MAEWLRTLIFRALNHLSAYRCWFKPGLVTCETSQVLLADGQVFFLGDLPFSPYLMIDSAQDE